MANTLDINREIAAIRSVPGGNWLALALTKIQQFSATIPTTTASATPTASTTASTAVTTTQASASPSSMPLLLAGNGITIYASSASDTIQANEATTTSEGILELAQDLGGTALLPKVTGIQGVPVDTTAPTNGQVLEYNSGTGKYVPTDLASSLSSSDALKLGHGISVTAAHKAAAPETAYTFLSYDGVTWTQFGNSPAIADRIRDPVLLHYDGIWWIAATNWAGGDANHNNWALYQSTDLVTWSAQQLVGTGMSAAKTAAPKWFVDADDSVHILLQIGGTTSRQIYEMHPTARNMSTWSAPVAVTGSGLPSDMIDADMVRIQDTYYLFFKDNTPAVIDLATSTSLTSGYTVVQSGDWAGWKSGSGNHGIEGPNIVQLDNGRWRMYFVSYIAINNINGLYYSETTASNLQSGWSAPAAMSTLVGYDHPSPERLPSALDMEEYTVSSLNALTGPVTLKAGSNVTLSASGQDITIASTAAGGVTTLDGISGAVTLVAGTGISITDNSPVAGDITITASGASADYVVMSDGHNPPAPMDDGAGNFLYTGYTP